MTEATPNILTAAVRVGVDGGGDNLKSYRYDAVAGPKQDCARDWLSRTESLLQVAVAAAHM